MYFLEELGAAAQPVKYCCYLWPAKAFAVCLATGADSAGLGGWFFKRGSWSCVLFTAAAKLCCPKSLNTVGSNVLSMVLGEAKWRSQIHNTFFSLNHKWIASISRAGISGTARKNTYVRPSFLEVACLRKLWGLGCVSGDVVNTMKVDRICVSAIRNSFARVLVMQIAAILLFKTNGSTGRQLNSTLLYSSNLTLFPPAVETEVKTAAPGAAPNNPAPSSGSPTSPTAEVAASVDKEMSNPHAIPRRHAPIEQLARQGSFRGFPALSQKMSPFKRQLSLRINELPSTVQRKTDFPMKNSGKTKRFQCNVALNCLFLLSLSVASSNFLFSSKSFFRPHVDHLSWANITMSENFCFGKKEEFQMWSSHAEDSSNCCLKYWSTAWSVPGMGVGELVGFGSSLWVTEPVLPLTVRASWDTNPFKALTTCLGIMWCSSAVCPSACLNSFERMKLLFTLH